MKKNLVSYRSELIKPSKTLSITLKAKELKASGVDVISLAGGEPDFDTPDHIKDAAIKAILQGNTKYTVVDGIVELKAAIIEKFKRENGLDYTTDEITVGCGAKHVIMNILFATINPDDEVLIPTPYWVSYPDMVRISGGKPVILETGDDFRLNADTLRAGITDKVKWLILNSPCNPSGVRYSYQELMSFKEVLDDYPNVNIISDEIYESIFYGDEKIFSIANTSVDMKNRTIVVNGVSKTYAMTGWRIGYAAGDKSIIKTVAKIQSQSTSNPCSISQYAALEAISSEKSKEFVKKNVDILKNRKEFVVEFLSDIFNIIEPEGTFYIFVDCRPFLGNYNGLRISNSVELSEYLLQDALIAVVPGIAFGKEGYIRISYVLPDEQLKNALSRLKQSCLKLKNSNAI